MASIVQRFASHNVAYKQPPHSIENWSLKIY